MINPEIDLSPYVRKATHSDIDDLMRMCELFFSKTGYEDIVEFDKTSMLNTLDNLLTEENYILYIAKSGDETIGMIGTILYPFYFNNSHLTGQELFWWIDFEYRKSGVGALLLNAIEEESKKKGAKSFSMIALDSMNPEIVGGIYKDRGYKNSEHSYIRSL